VGPAHHDPRSDKSNVGPARQDPRFDKSTWVLHVRTHAPLAVHGFELTARTHASTKHVSFTVLQIGRRRLLGARGLRYVRPTRSAAARGRVTYLVCTEDLSARCVVLVLSCAHCVGGGRPRRHAHADRAARPGLLIESARAMNDSEISRDGKKADDVNGGA
jgi:hypothetical protein